jgi:tetratricopeptide (TPR) repeat protein
MSANRFLAGVAAGALLVGGLGGAASADVVRLRSGDILEGKATDLGESVRVVTGEATVELPWSEIKVIDRAATAADDLKARRAAVKDDDAKGLFALALWCQRQGMPEQAADLARKVVALEPANEGARAILGEQNVCPKCADCPEWKKGDALLSAKGFVARDGKWILKSEAEALDRRAAIDRQASDEEKRAAKLLESLGDRTPAVRTYAAEALASLDPALRRRLFLVGARHRNEAVRAASAAGLGLKHDEGVVRTLLQLAVKDPSADVRGAAAKSLRAVDVPEVASPLIRCLDAGSPAVRMAAADALGTMGTRTSVETLIRRVHWVAGPSNRANIQVLNQISYIGDYDVEIAQLSQIGDPIIMQLREGIVLDVKVFAAEGTDLEIERHAYVQALGNITGKTFGNDVKAWASWWTEEGRKTYAAAEAAERANN